MGKPPIYILGSLLVLLSWLVYENSQAKPTVTVHEGVRPSLADTPAPAPATDELPAGAGCNASEVWVDNKGGAVWTDARIEVNGTYEYSPGAVMGGGRQPYLAHLFTKSDGTPLSLASVACKSIDIHATVNGKRAHWNGAYR